MALRTMWSGVLEVNTLFKAHVSICKGSEDYRGKDQLRELCSCCHEPFDRKTVCERGRLRLTEALEKSGEINNTTQAVKGVLGEGDKYVVLTDEALEGIAAAGTSDGMAVAAVVDIDRVPTERNRGLYYLQPDSKVKRSQGEIEVVCAALKRDRTAIITKWAPRGREMLVAIYPKDGALVMNSLMFDSEIRAPDEKCLITTDDISDGEVDVACQVMATLPNEFDFTSATDEAVTVRQQAIEAARKGKPIPTREPVADTEAVPDLMAALRAATKGTPVAKAKKAAAKNGKVPAGAAA
jgi:DNA end-binding protein Ku